MASRFAIEALDRTLRDIMKQVDPRYGDIIFGGKTIIFGGDFKQTLTVVEKASPAQIIDQCIISSQLWSQIRKLQLTINQRLTNNQRAIPPENETYATFLQTLGNGTVYIFHTHCLHILFTTAKMFS